MSQAALFGFGCVIFFVVLTGALFYGMATVKEIADRSKYRITFVALSHRQQQTPDLLRTWCAVIQALLPRNLQG